MSRTFCRPLVAALSLAACGADAQLLLNPAQPIGYELRVQPILTRQASAEGGNTATFFGDAGQQLEIEGYVDTIWAQLGIDVTFLAPIVYESSFAYDGFPGDYSAGLRPESDMSSIFTSGPASPDPSVLNVFFVEIVPGFSQSGEYTANGLSFLDRNGVAVFVGDGLLTFTGGREVIAKVVAHEIGHSLGLPHLVEAQNLMQQEGSPNAGHRLSAAQLSTILTDDFGNDGHDFLVAIPEPSVGGICLALWGMFCVRRRR